MIYFTHLLFFQAINSLASLQTRVPTYLLQGSVTPGPLPAISHPHRMLAKYVRAAPYHPLSLIPPPLNRWSSPAPPQPQLAESRIVLSHPPLNSPSHSPVQMRPSASRMCPPMRSRRRLGTSTGPAAIMSAAFQQLPRTSLSRRLPTASPLCISSAI
jgi:hypothetical protein